MPARHESEPPLPASLRFGDDPPLEIANEDQLEDGLRTLSEVRNGQIVILSRATNNYLKATRCGEFWSATVRRGSIWTAGDFTAGSTTEYSDREVKKAREATSLWKRLFDRTPPGQALSTRQIRHLFLAYFLGLNFEVPFAGAD